MIILRKLLIISFILILSICFFSCSASTDSNKNNDTTTSEPFANVPETQDIILYEVNLRAFSPSGDFQGVIARLDSIKALSVNVIWLMPIYPVGDTNSVNSPYCVKNYLQVNPEFGSLKDLKTLIDTAHKKNMAVILDWVANHTSWDNPWIKNRSWYTQENGEIISPKGTNWSDVADLNYDNADMRSAMIEALKYWILEANIDGYRCDAADYVPFDFWQQALDSLELIPNRKLILLAEGSRHDHFTAGFQMIYAWDFYTKLKQVFSGANATGLYTTHMSEYRNMPEGKQRLRYTTNHDGSAWEAAPVELFNGINGALAASVITIYMGGVPLIYGSQEVGTASRVPIFSNSQIPWDQNPEMVQAYKDILGIYTISEAAKGGSLTDYSTNEAVCFSKKSNPEEILVVVNVRDYPVDFTLPDALQNSTWTNTISQRSETVSQTYRLNSYEYKILKR